MERAEVLILKLQEQYRKREPMAEMLLTLQLLEQELMKGSHIPVPREQKSRVSVVLPFRSAPDFSLNREMTEKDEKVIEMLHIDENEIERELEEMRRSAELKNELGFNSRPSLQAIYDPMEDVPTLAIHSPSMGKTKPFAKQAVLEKTESGTEINDILKESKPELAQKLQDVPIRDLRKAIGINDRYLFINELFSGDEAMFERSLKTLDQFSIFPEAEFWMKRELKLKLGWNEDMLLVQQFSQLVKRRFS
jgi:hypothetical protein